MNPAPADAARLQRFSGLTLPTLPAGTPYLIESLGDEGIEYDELAAVLEKFPSIAGKLISMANSAWSAPVAEVSTLETACARLGFGVVRSASIALAVSAPFDAARCQAFDSEYFWCSALLTADAAYRLSLVAAAASAAQAATARAAGLMHNLGLLWLADEFPGAVDRALNMTANGQSEGLRQALTRVLGFDQADAANRLAIGWNLPGPLAMAIRHYHDADYRDAQKTVVNAVGLAARLVASILADAPCPATDRRLAELGIATSRFDEVRQQLEEQSAKTRAIARMLV